jgi:S-adenosylmethionine uptake transporter
MSASSLHPKPAIPFAVATLGIALFSGMDALMKGLSLAIGTYNALLWRTLAGALIGGAVYVLTRSQRPGRAALRVHLVRGTMGSIMALTFFWGLARVPMAQAIALAFVAPLIALYLAAVILKERIDRAAVLASLLGFAGVVVILAGQVQADMGREALLGSASILVSAGLYGWNIILMRQQAQLAGPVEIAFFVPLIMVACFALGAPYLAVPPPLGQLPSIIGSAFLAFGSLMLLSWAYARAEAQRLAPVEYTGFIWASIFGWLIFAEPVQPLTLAGAAMIVGACWAATRPHAAPMPAVEAGA